MNFIEYDAVIIGAGVSGLAAGAFLAENGFRVAVVTAGEPTACLSTGCIDVCSRDHNPLRGLRLLPKEHPFHLVPERTIREALSRFLAVAADGGIPYTGDEEANRYILSALGTFKTTCLVPATMAAAPQRADEAVHIISFTGLKDFYPSYIISRRPNSTFSEYNAGVSTTMGLAAHFEEDAFLEDFISWLRKIEIPQDKIAFPAVLGLESAAAVSARIAAALERSVFEIPTLPPSMPGRRLFNALKDHFRRQGGDIYWSQPVIGVERTKSIIESVITESAGRPRSFHAKAFVLAGGSFIGGGLKALREKIVENIFNLPVHAPGRRETWFDNDFFSLNHSIGKAGIIADTSFRPQASPWENIFVCGGILADAEILKNGCGHGLALATGRAAAESCAGYMR